VTNAAKPLSPEVRAVLEGKPPKLTPEQLKAAMSAAERKKYDETGEIPHRLNYAERFTEEGKKQTQDGQTPALETYTAREIDALDLPPPDEVVPGLFVVGSTLFGAKPKDGKTYLVLNVGYAVAIGGKALGQISCDAGNVLLLLLEDNKRRFKKRMRQLVGNEAANADLPANLQVAFSARRVNEGLASQIRNWHRTVTAAGGNPRLVAIDTLTAVRPLGTDKRSAFVADYALCSGLTELAHELQIALVIVHHMRKATSEDILDDMSGTLGLNAAVDTIVGLRKAGTGYELIGRGRDIEEFSYGLQRGDGKWIKVGSAADLRTNDNSRKIIRVLEESDGPMSPGEIAKETGLKVHAVRWALEQMLRHDDSVEKAEYGKYRLKPAPF
jgi:RecA-family ATPase